MMKCLKKINEIQRSGAAASKTPTCKFFHQLLFLKDIVSNRETNSNVPITVESQYAIETEVSLTESSISTTAQQSTIGSLRETSISTTPTTKTSESHSPIETSITTTARPTAKPTTPSNKRKDDETSNQIYGRKYKKMDRQEKIDLLLVDALRKSDDSQDKNSTKSSNQLFCESIVELLDKLPAQKNRMARVEIQQLLLKYEFEDVDYL